MTKQADRMPTTKQAQLLKIYDDGVWVPTDSYESARCRRMARKGWMSMHSGGYHRGRPTYAFALTDDGRRALARYEAKHGKVG